LLCVHDEILIRRAITQNLQIVAFLPRQKGVGTQKTKIKIVSK